MIPGIEKTDVLDWAIWPTVMAGTGLHRAGHDDWAVFIVESQSFRGMPLPRSDRLQRAVITNGFAAR
jgi:hypothetical protein